MKTQNKKEKYHKIKSFITADLQISSNDDSEEENIVQNSE